MSKECKKYWLFESSAIISDTIRNTDTIGNLKKCENLIDDDHGRRGIFKH